MAKSENVECYCATCTSANVLPIKEIITLLGTPLNYTHACSFFEGLRVRSTDLPLTQRSPNQDLGSCHSAAKLD